MEIKNLKDLKAVIKACRQLGVDTIEIGSVKFQLGKAPNSYKTKNIDTEAFPEADMKVPQFTGEISDVEPITTEELTPDQLLNWSAQGHETVEQ